MASDRELLDLYAEELFVDEQHLAVDDADAQQAALSTTRGVAIQACHPRRAQSSTLLFDVAECPQPVSQLLDYDHCKREQVQEAAIEYAPVRPGRSLTRPSPVYIDAALNELAKVSKQMCSPLPSLHSYDGFYKLEDDYEHVLRQITRRNFLPGIEHLCAVETRSAFITYDKDTQFLPQAVAEVFAYRNQCALIGDKVSALTLPGENFFLADNLTGLGFSAQYPTAKSLLTLIDELVDGESLVEDLTDPPNCQQKQSTSNVFVSPGSFFDIPSSQFGGYTALDQILGFSCGISYAVCAQSDATDDVSDTSDEVAELTIAPSADMSDEEDDDLSMLLPSTLSYFDIKTQHSVAYIAFNQLLMGLDSDETLPRIHRSYDDFDDDDFTSAECILEISELPDNDLVYGLHALHNSAVGGSLSLPGQNEDAPFDTDPDFDSVQYPLSHVTATTVRPRPIDSLRSYSSLPRRPSNRSRLVVNAHHLSDVMEVSSDESNTLSRSSSDSSGAFIDFANRRGFVRPPETRRSDFLADEDSDDGI